MACTSCRTGRWRPPRRPCRAPLAGSKWPSQHPREGQGVERSRGSAEVDPAPSQLCRETGWRCSSCGPRRRDRGQPVDLGERVAQHAVGVGGAESAAAAWSPMLARFAFPPSTCVCAGGGDQRGGEHDGSGAPRGFEQRFVGSRRRGTVERDVIHDQPRPAACRLRSRARAAGARRDSAAAGEAVVVDTHDHNARGRGLPAPDREAHVDRGALESAEQPSGVCGQPGRRRQQPDREQSEETSRDGTPPHDRRNVAVERLLRLSGSYLGVLWRLLRSRRVTSTDILGAYSTPACAERITTTIHVPVSGTVAARGALATRAGG